MEALGDRLEEFTESISIFHQQRQQQVKIMKLKLKFNIGGDVVWWVNADDWFHFLKKVT